MSGTYGLAGKLSGNFGTSRNPTSGGLFDQISKPSLSGLANITGNSNFTNSLSPETLKLMNREVPAVKAVTKPSVVASNPVLDGSTAESYSSQNMKSFSSPEVELVKPPEKTLEESPWYTNSENLSAASGLASVLVQAAALPEQLKTAKAQRRSLEHNLQTAKDNAAHKALVRSNLSKG